MATIHLGSFTVAFPIGGKKSDISVTFDFSTQRITWRQNNGYGNNGAISYDAISEGGNRGYAEGEAYRTACDGYTKYIFKASTRAPWVTFDVFTDSEDCGFIMPPPVPEPLPPAPVCDLEVAAESTSITGFDKTDGTITAEISTSQEGNYAINILRSGTNDIVQNIVVSRDAPSYTFLNLPTGNYDVKANSVDYDCEAQTTISVSDVAFNEKYHFFFCEERFDKRKIRLSIKKAGYDGVSTLIKNGAYEIAKINYPEKGDEIKFKPVLGSECTIQLIADEIFSLEEIYTDEEKQYLLQLSFEDTGDLIWTGFILPEQSNEPFTAKPYPVTFVASDGVKVLDAVDFDKLEGRLTFLEGIKYCLDKTGFKLGFKTAIDIVNIDASKFVILSGLDTNVYGDTIVVTPGTYNHNGNLVTVVSSINIPLSDLRTINYRGKVFISLDGSGSVVLSANETAQTTLLATVDLLWSMSPRIHRVSNFENDTLANHTFDVKRFLKDDAEFTDCFEVLEAICKQFTAQIKQADGVWVIENIGNKGRNSTVLESAYNNDLSVIYENQPVDLLRELDCDSEGKIISGAYLSNGAAYKKSIVAWQLGFPKPVILNWNFEDWIDDGGKEIPYGWDIPKPYNYFYKGSKLTRTYNPTDASVIEEEDGSYFFSYKRLEVKDNIGGASLIQQSIRSYPIAVFSQEVLNISFQSIMTNRREIIFTTFGIFRLSLAFKIKIGNQICANFKPSGSQGFAPQWMEDDGDLVYLIEMDITPDKFNNYGDSTNIDFSLPPAPFQGYATIEIVPNFSWTLIWYANIDGISILENVRGFYFSDLGFDNFKLSKSSPVDSVKILEETVITVENKKTFSTIPEPFEVYFGDVDNAFRTDGIKDLSGNPTKLWQRKSIEEADNINNILAREILSQYQNTFRIMEGSVIARNLSIRSIFNLPEYELYRFATVTGEYDLIKCEANVTMVEIYAEEAPNSGTIGGGGGGSNPGNPTDEVLVLASKNNIFTDGNDNIFLANGD